MNRLTCEIRAVASATALCSICLSAASTDSAPALIHLASGATCDAGHLLAQGSPIAAAQGAQPDLRNLPGFPPTLTRDRETALRNENERLRLLVSLLREKIEVLESNARTAAEGK